jgi:hypothetical protein
VPTRAGTVAVGGPAILEHDALEDAGGHVFDEPRRGLDGLDESVRVLERLSQQLEMLSPRLPWERTEIDSGDPVGFWTLHSGSVGV